MAEAEKKKLQKLFERRMHEKFIVLLQPRSAFESALGDIFEGLFRTNTPMYFHLRGESSDMGGGVDCPLVCQF